MEYSYSSSGVTDNYTSSTYAGVQTKKLWPIFCYFRKTELLLQEQYESIL